MTFREDESRIRGPQIRENMAWLNRLALSLLKQHPSKESIVGKRQLCGWDDAFLLEVRTGITAYHLGNYVPHTIKAAAFVGSADKRCL